MCDIKQVKINNKSSIDLTSLFTEVDIKLELNQVWIIFSLHISFCKNTGTPIFLFAWILYEYYYSYIF